MTHGQFFWRSFVVATALMGMFRIAMGLVPGVDDVGESLVDILGFSIPWGAMMAGFWTWLQAKGVRRRGFDPDDAVGLATEVRGELLLGVPAPDALELCRRALDDAAGHGRARVDAAAGTVRARAGSFWARDPTLDLECRAVPEPGGTRVVVESRPAFGAAAADGGLGREHVARVQGFLLARALPPSAGAAP